MKVWIDTDTGIDDALAIVLSIKSREFEIVGVSSVHGNVDVENAAINARTMIEMSGENIPVWRGSKFNLLGESYAYPDCHGKDGLADVITTRSCNNIESGFGPLMLADYLLKSDEEITVVALGPLTNIALALSYSPGCFGNRHKLIVMGGAMLVQGNETASAEFNTWCDPEAAYRVIHSNIEQTWISLDATMKTIIDSSWCDKMMEREDELNRVLGRITKFYSLWYRKFYNIDGFALHDPLTIGYLLWPDLFTIESIILEIELCGSSTRGKTVPDFYGGNFLKSGANINIATDVDSELFIEKFKNIFL